jgi:hypothetical protein
VSASKADEAQPELVFHKFENQYFLSRLVPGDGNEREIVLTPAKMKEEIVAAGLNP